MGFYNSDHRVLLLRPCVLVDTGPKPFRFQPHWFGEELLLSDLEGWWNEQVVDGDPGFILHKKIKGMKVKIKAWVRSNLNKVEKKIELLEGILRSFELEDRLLTENEVNEKHVAQQNLCSLSSWKKFSGIRKPDY